MARPLALIPSRLTGALGSRSAGTLARLLAPILLSPDPLAPSLACLETCLLTPYLGSLQALSAAALEEYEGIESMIDDIDNVDELAEGIGI